MHLFLFPYALKECAVTIHFQLKHEHLKKKKKEGGAEFNIYNITNWEWMQYI